MQGKTKIQNKKSVHLSPIVYENLKRVLSFLDTENFALVGTASNYFNPMMKEIDREYSKDIDIALTRKYISKHPELEDKLYSEGFVKGAIVEEISENRRRVLPDSYVLMKYENGIKRIDILLGFHISSQYFYKPIQTKRDIKTISEKNDFENTKINVIKFPYQLAEKLMLPEEKRAKSFHKLFELAKIQNYDLNELAQIVGEIIIDYSRNNSSIKKWWEEFVEESLPLYLFGSKKTIQQKQRFFKKLEKHFHSENLL